MSRNVPGWIPRGPVKDDVPPRERCVHRARARHDAMSCSARGRWGRWDDAAVAAATPDSIRLCPSRLHRAPQLTASKRPDRER